MVALIPHLYFASHSYFKQDTTPENPMRSILLFSTLTLIFSLPAANCLADVIYLKNGDRLSGTITNMEDLKLIFWTKYAGEIVLFWHDVERFEIDDPSKIVLKSPAKQPVTEVAKESSTKIAETPAEPNLNPENILAISPIPVVPVKITAEANTQLKGERGNTHKDIYSVSGKFTARTEWQRYMLDGEYDHEKKNTTTTEDNWLLHGRFSQFIDKERYIYLSTLLENDKFKDLQLRSTYGLGAGYQFAEQAQINLSLSLGFARVTDNFYLAESKEFSAGQWAFGFDRYFLRNQLQFFHTNHGYCSLENKKDWLVKSKTGLKVPLYGGFTATLQYEYEWDNEPASDAETKYDSELMLLLGYEFKN